MRRLILLIVIISIAFILSASNVHAKTDDKLQKMKQNASLNTKDAKKNKYIEAGLFAVRESKELHVTYNGQVLIESDALTPLKSFEDVENISVDQVKNATALNVIQDNNDAFKFRKEVAVHKDGTIELTVKTDYTSYKSDYFRKYSFKIPFKILEGCSYTVREGACTWNWDTKGKITADMPNGSIIENWRKRFIAFEKKGLKIVFDGNPLGPRNVADYPMGGEPMTCWGIGRSGDYIEFSTLLRVAKSAGGIFAAKILIYDGSYDYKEKHPLQVCSYYSTGKTNRPEKHFAFGTVQITEGGVTKACSNVSASPVIPATVSRYTAKQGYGWKERNNIQLLKTHPTNVFKNGVVAPEGGKNTFSFDIRPAYYVATVHVGHPTKDIGPLDISINDTVIARDIKVKAGETETIFGSYYLRDPERQLCLTFSGKDVWAVNKIAAQAVIYPNEDYVFDRKLWVKGGLYEPDISINTNYTSSSKQWTPKAKSKDELDWRWNMRMTSWSQGNSSTFEFNTPELCERRAIELKNSGYNTINYGCYFWNLAYTHLEDEIIAQTKMVVDACHKYELKVIYHLDVPIIIGGGTGLEYMIKHADWGMRDIRYDISSLQKVCFNNPYWRKEFFTRLKELVGKTGLDGGMFDEVYFDDAEYCGCEHCRKIFTQETGAVLPRDPASPVFLNKESPLWMQWLDWRVDSCGKWSRTVLENLQEANPNFCMVVYGNESDLIHGWRFANRGGYSMFAQSKWGAQFIGTEIDLRNPMDNYRHIGATRKVASAIGSHYNNPIWGLICNNDDPHIIYFTWALNHMQRQVSWLTLNPEWNMGRYLQWSDKMKGRYARSMADTAILCSISLRDTDMKDPQGADMHGYSQCMTDAHIMHDFILKGDLISEKLQQYKRLVIASVEPLSAKHVKAVRQYVAGGGTLLVSGYAGLTDENYNSSENFPLADVMGVDCNFSAPLLKVPFSIQFKADDVTVPFSLATRRVSIRKDAHAEVLAEITEADKIVPIPAIVVNRYKKGKCIYVAPQLGREVYDPGCHSGREWAYEKNLLITKLLTKVVTLTGGDDQFMLKAIQVPEKVIMTVYRSQTEKGGNQVLIHLLNATGATDFKKGDVVPMKKSGIVFPPLNKDVILEIKELISNAYVVSPDYQGKHSVQVETQANGYTRITLNKKDLQAFSIIYLTNEEK